MLQRPSNDACDGAALVVVLLIAVLVVGAASHGLLLANRIGRATAAGLAATELRLAAWDGAWQALQRIADDPDPAIDHTNEAWAASTTIKLPSGIVVDVRVADENRFVNLNSLAVAPAASDVRRALTALFALRGSSSADALATAFADWVDDDDTGPFESEFYARRDPPYAAADKPLGDWPEARLVAGAGAALTETATAGREAPLADVVTVLPTPRTRPVGVNVNTAGRDVLLALAGPAATRDVDRLLAVRAAQPLASIEPLLSGRPAPARRFLASVATVRSSHFRVEAIARKGSRSRRLWAVARRAEDGRVTPLRWAVQ